MKMIVSGTVLAAVAASILLAASPASAAAWSCTARDHRDAHFTGNATGPFSNAVRDRARDKALIACRADSVIKASCVILDCVGG
ncbi:MAG: hypothetical protein WDM84_04930 [Bauldia sp.]